MSVLVAEAANGARRRLRRRRDRGHLRKHPDVERIVICEIEPLIPQVVAQYFAAENYSVLTDPRVEVVYDDARHYTVTATKSLTSSPPTQFIPGSRGPRMVYTRGILRVVQTAPEPGRRREPRWVPLYDSDRDTVRSEIATFFDTFPGGTVWSNLYNGEGYALARVG